MEMNDLKMEWNRAEAPVKTAAELKIMLKESQHPVLKAIRKQILIEVCGWTAFLLCYYTMFDGDQKPLFINALLIVTVLCAILHSLTGYSFARYMPEVGDIKTGLQHYLGRIKVYAAVSLVARLLFMAGFLSFFAYNIHFTNFKYAMMGVFGLIVVVQLIWLGRIWTGRVTALRQSISRFE